MRFSLWELRRFSMLMEKFWAVAAEELRDSNVGAGAFCPLVRPLRIAAQI